MSSKSRGGLRNGPPSQARIVTVSKSLSWLLRHGAEKERISMSSDGYISVSDLLNWHKLKSLRVDFEEIVDVIKDNEKQRFALRYLLSESAGEKTSGKEVAHAADISTLDDELAPNSTLDLETENQKALRIFTTMSDQDPAHFQIRATQGHSLKTLDTASYLKPINLENLPNVVVHGTFLKFWPAILKTGGLKSMSRVHVHFASGPSISDLGLNEWTGGEMADDKKPRRNLLLQSAMEKGQVVSGMRKDAEVLIYVDIRKALEIGMEWFISENGVVLTEGMLVRGKNSKMVPIDVWDAVVEVGHGMGIIWRQEGDAELPQHLGINESAVDGGRTRKTNGKNGKQSGKPKLVVERNEVDAEDNTG